MIKICLALLLCTPGAGALSAKDYLRHPKLIVVIVIDQFRADYLTRFAKEFVPAGTERKPGGFRFLMERGAYFPFASYDVLQAMTCPGHAMILTGTRPALNGISLNDWYSPATGKVTYCVQDDERGPSPRRLLTTTVGDELKNVHAKSRVISISLKDRAAIMLGGHRADEALWLTSEGPLQWKTSPYYSGLRPWTVAVNEGLAKEKHGGSPEGAVKDATESMRTILRAGLEAVRGEKLGRGSDPDLLAISLSNHDSLGHALGPNAAEMEALTVAEDQLLAEFLRDLRAQLGTLDDVVIALTADHGIPPKAELARENHLDSGRIDSDALVASLNQEMKAQFGGSDPWIQGQRFLHFFLNRAQASSKKVDLAALEAAAIPVIEKVRGVQAVFTRSMYERGVFPPGPVGEQLKNSYLPTISGDIVVVPRPFYVDTTGHVAVNHMTGWSYDRTVPLVLWGRSLKPGVYPGGLVIDLAPTLSFLLGILPPATNEGRVLAEALK